MSDPDREIWRDMLAHLRANHATVCRQWFEELRPEGVAGGMVQLRAGSDLHRDYLRRQCAEPFNDAARTVSGRLLSVRFLGPSDAAAPPAPAPSRRGDATMPVQEIEPRPRSRVVESSEGAYESLVFNPDYAFENFVVGPNNRLSHAAALAIAANPGRVYNPYFVHGGVGLGKTHLLQAVCLKIKEANPGGRVHYTSCESFTTQFFESVASGTMAEFHHRFRDVDVLVIDDIHFLTKRDRSQEEFFHTFNALHQSGRQIILSSDAAPDEIPMLEQRLVSRFQSGLVTKIASPDYETRIQILKTKARLRGLTLPDDVAEFIAARIDSNIRELEGAVVKLQLQSVVEKHPIDLALAKAALGGPGDHPAGEPSIQSIIAAVTEHYGIRLADLQSKHRQRSIALPRQVCMSLARKCTRHSLEEIGGFFGGRDHTTVMHAIRTIDARRAKQPDFDGVLRALEDRIRGSVRPVG